MSRIDGSPSRRQATARHLVSINLDTLAPWFRHSQAHRIFSRCYALNILCRVPMSFFFALFPHRQCLLFSMGSTTTLPLVFTVHCSRFARFPSFCPLRNLARVEDEKAGCRPLVGRGAGAFFPPESRPSNLPHLA